MKRPWVVLPGFLTICFLATSNAGGGQPLPESGVRTIPLTRSVRLPTIKLSQGQDLEDLSGNSALVVWPGATDEPPEGPNGFDVFDDGSFVIADPLPKRVDEFDGSGQLRRTWRPGFAPDSVTVLSSGLIVVREAATGQSHVFDREGHPHAGQEVSPPQPSATRLVNRTTATVARPGKQGTLEVHFERPGLVLLSLESLATDDAGNTYVALESTGGAAGEGIDVNKYVRKYSADGRLLSEVADIPLDYYVTPVDELRVHKGIVYQLYVASSEARINIWDMN